MDWLPTYMTPDVSTLAIDAEVEVLIRRRGATPSALPTTLARGMRSEGDAWL